MVLATSLPGCPTTLGRYGVVYEDSTEVSNHNSGRRSKSGIEELARRLEVTEESFEDMAKARRSAGWSRGGMRDCIRVNSITSYSSTIDNSSFSPMRAMRPSSNIAMRAFDLCIAACTSSISSSSPSTAVKSFSHSNTLRARFHLTGMLLRDSSTATACRPLGTRAIWSAMSGSLAIDKELPVVDVMVISLRTGSMCLPCLEVIKSFQDETTAIEQ